MDFVFFLKIISWIALVIGVLGAASTFYFQWYHTHTASGKLEVMQAMLRGQQYVYAWWKPALIAVIATAALVSFH